MHIRNLFLSCIMLGSLSLNAQTKDEKAVAEAVETLRKTMVDPDKATLDRLTSVKLTYGHSSGKVEDKASFINSLISKTSDFESITLSNQTILISGNTAIVRHNLDGATIDGGKPATVKLHVMLVWNQKGTSWQLLGRQAVKLAQ